MANPIVSGISQYVDENKTGLIAKSVLGAKSASLFNLMSGVKGPATLNLLNTDVVLQDGSECGWSASGSSEISQRVLTPAHLKVNMSFCDKNLLKTWKNYEVKVAAGQKTLPFEEDFMNGIADGVAEAIEKMIYQGTGSNGDFEGLISILGSAVPTGNTKTEAQGTPAYTAIKDAYMALPERAIKDDTVILVGAGLFRKFIQELVSANLYHFNPNDKEGEYMLPGTNVKVIAVNGLNETATYDYIIAGRLSNLFYGISGENDTDTLDVWYSKDNQEFRVAVEAIVGVQVAYPSEVAFVKVTK